MGEIAQEYLVPDGMSAQQIKELITRHLPLVEDPEHDVTSRFFDSFDWRLYLAGASVEARRMAERHQLMWHDLRADAPPCQQTIDGEPGLVRDIPEGPVRKLVEPVLGIRCMLPLLDVHSRVQALRLLNDDDKTVVRLQLEQNRFSDPARDREGPLSTRLRLLPVRGYEAELQKAARTLQRELGLGPAPTRELLEALAAAGRCPGDYSSKLDYHLDPDERADATTKEILLGLLDTLEANIDGAKANLDSEFLHDLRVATRRTRSALTQIKGVFPPDLVEDFKGRFAWVQQITGPVRDLDVYLLDFDSYQASLPAPLRPHLEPMRDFLTAHYDMDHKTMVRALESAKFKNLLKSWRAFLEAPVPERSAVSNAMRPSKEVASSRIWGMYRRVRKEGRAITPSSPPEELHELRKSCKKLRYLLEFFSSLYPKKPVGSLVKMLKVLLDNLGRFQDVAVQARHLREMAQQMRDEGRAETDTLLAMGVLVGDLFSHQVHARTEFSRIFSDFDKRENQLLFRELFAPEEKRGQRS